MILIVAADLLLVQDNIKCVNERHVVTVYYKHLNDSSPVLSTDDDQYDFCEITFQRPTKLRKNSIRG